jgi:hypothetical protein
MSVEPSEKTKALLEKTRAARAAAGEDTKTVTVIEDANPPEANANDDLSVNKRSNDKLAAEQARGKQVLERHHHAHLRAVAAQKASEGGDEDGEAEDDDSQE